MKKRTAPELLQLTYILYEGGGGETEEKEEDAVKIQTTKLKSMHTIDPNTDTEL